MEPAHHLTFRFADKLICMDRNIDDSSITRVTDPIDMVGV